MIRVPRSTTSLSAFFAAVGVAVGVLMQVRSGVEAPAGLLQYSLVATGTSALGGFVLWHRPRNRYGLIHLGIGVLFATAVLAAGLLAFASVSNAIPAWVAESALAWSWACAAILLPLWIMAIATFPDGRFHRPAVQRATVTVAGLIGVLSAVAYLFAPGGQPPPLIRAEVPDHVGGLLAGVAGGETVFEATAMAGAVLSGLAPIGAIVALLHRFRREEAIVRQQIKWLLVGGAISVGLQALPVQALDPGALRTAGEVLVILAVPLPLLAAALAIFRHGLWEIDLVISKGLVYTLLTGALSILFLGIALLAGVSVAGTDGRAMGALALALIVSFLAQPLRQRLEQVVSRLLYGDAPPGLKGLARLGTMVDDSPDAAILGDRITAVIRNSLGAEWAAIWLYLPTEGGGRFRAVASSGREAGSSVLVPAESAERIIRISTGRRVTDLDHDDADAVRSLVSERDALVAPLTAGDELIGLITCGDPPAESFGDGDIHLITVIARESALALRNLRLEGELRQQLEQIEDQAAELRRSRQRLVAAQDEERRRIERNLHDGAQQQLVTLAARLRRAAHAAESVDDAALEELADEAEEAVFSLQELARGIYPSLLSDRGLEAALKAHAARLPIDVRLDVSPSMKGRRLPSDLEAAFYFVALEAMTNVLKHASAARMIVTLGADPSKRRVLLEVHDDGPGFDSSTARRGSGLQNMADRMGAVGGSFTVESRTNAGTWIRAEAPDMAEVTDLRTRRATP